MSFGGGEGGGGEISEGGRAGRARFLGIWPRGEIPRDLAPGGRDHGGAKSLRQLYSATAVGTSASGF